MHYRAPPLPVDLRYLNSTGSIELNNLVGTDNISTRGANTAEDQILANEEARDAQIREFRQIALHKHNIRLS